MQKKIIALAIAGLASSAAFAQSNVTVYGRVDYGYESRGGGSGGVDTDGRKGEMASGMQAGSRIGFKGSEDLGNGLKAVFQLESGIQNDANNGGSSAGIWSALNRNAYVGLSSSNWGTLVGGRLDGVRYGIFNKYDSFAGGGMGNWTQMTGQVDRADNAVAWISPNWKGFGLVLAHSRDVGGQEVAGTQTLNNTAANGTKANTSDGRLYTIMGTYDNGPLSLTADYETVRVAKPNDAAGGTVDDLYVVTLAASYDFGFMKVRALWDKHQADASNNFAIANGNPTDYTDWFLAATVPYGNFLFKFTYGSINDKRNAAEWAAAGGVGGDAKKWGIGMNYNLSKRTNIYADYGHISNDNNANYAIAPAANTGGVGYGTNGFNIGLAHNF